MYVPLPELRDHLGPLEEILQRLRNRGLGIESKVFDAVLLESATKVRRFLAEFPGDDETHKNMGIPDLILRSERTFELLTKSGFKERYEEILKEIGSDNEGVRLFLGH